MTNEESKDADSASVSTDGLERAAFEAWSGSAPVEFENSSGDRLAFWCWQAWQAATKAERDACAKRAKAAIDSELETADGESLQQHVEDAIMARSNATGQRVAEGDSAAPTG